MIAFKPKHLSHTTTKLELTPLIDVIFILLLFFAVSSTLNVSKGIPIQLPSATTIQDLSEPHTLSISADGDYFLNKVPVTTEQLEIEIKTMIEVDPDSLINIKADKQTAYQYVILAMDIVRTNGGLNVSLETEKHRHASIEKK